MNSTFGYLMVRFPAVFSSGPHLDVAPPTGLIVTLGLGAIVALGVVVVGAVTVSILVIRAIKKRQNTKSDQ